MQDASAFLALVCFLVVALFSRIVSASFRPTTSLYSTTLQRVPLCKLVASAKDGSEVVPVFPIGTMFELTEKNRGHIGKIIDIERKGNGSTRDEVEVFPSGKHHFGIADKEVSFTIPPMLS